MWSSRSGLVGLLKNGNAQQHILLRYAFSTLFITMNYKGNYLPGNFVDHVVRQIAIITLNHWALVTHICVIGVAHNSLRRQAIIYIIDDSREESSMKFESECKTFSNALHNAIFIVKVISLRSRHVKVIYYLASRRLLASLHMGTHYNDVTWASASLSWITNCLFNRFFSLT